MVIALSKSAGLTSSIAAASGGVLKVSATDALTALGTGVMSLPPGVSAAATAIGVAPSTGLSTFGGDKIRDISVSASGGSPLVYTGGVIPVAAGSGGSAVPVTGGVFPTLSPSAPATAPVDVAPTISITPTTVSPGVTATGGTPLIGTAATGTTAATGVTAVAIAPTPAAAIAAKSKLPKWAIVALIVLASIAAVFGAYKLYTSLKGKK